MRKGKGKVGGEVAAGKGEASSIDKTVHGDDAQLLGGFKFFHLCNAQNATHMAGPAHAASCTLRSVAAPASMVALAQTSSSTCA